MSPPAEQPTFRIDTARGHYPIVYVRGFAATSGEREETFYDTYYGFAATAVEKRDAPPPQFMEPIVFEGQLIRLLKEYGYVDAANGGLTLALANASGATQNPARSLWISRFYDRDVVSEKVRPIEEHAEELRQLICETIPARLKSVEGASVDLGKKDEDYRVILLAHSMGGLVCRCLIQNLLPARKQDPARWIHRFVTMGTPHGGIELSAVPDFLEELAVAKGNVLKGAIFKEDRMREYLKLNRKDAQGELPPLNSLGGRFPEGRCLSIVGSDHASYGVVRRATGGAQRRAGEARERLHQGLLLGQRPPRALGPPRDRQQLRDLRERPSLPLRRHPREDLAGGPRPPDRPTPRRRRRSSTTSSSPCRFAGPASSCTSASRTPARTRSASRGPTSR